MSFDYIVNARGPWKTKAGGELMVLNATPLTELQKDGPRSFLYYEKNELERLPVAFDIRGLRTYTNRRIPAGTIGGTEFHRVRGKFIHCLDGEVEFTMENLGGEITKVMLSPTVGIFIPPYTLHAYTATKDDSGLLVICNTMFTPEDPQTHDTYPENEFRELQTKSVSI